jgi:hypothetical protein
MLVGLCTFEDLGADDRVEVGLHVVEDHVDVLVVLGLDDVEQADDVFVAVKLLQEHDLSESSLRICRIVERVEHLLEGDLLSVLLVDGLSDDSIGTFAYLLDDLELPEDVGLNLVGHSIVFRS